MKEREGEVKDLVEKLQRGELTPEEAKKLLKERGLMGQESWKWRVSYLMLWVAYFILCILPFPLKGQLQRISFPLVVVYGSLIPSVIGIFLTLWATYSHRKKGGLKGSGDTIILHRDGPYGFMRHPGIFCWIIWFIFIPIIISNHFPFTFLSIIGIILAVGYHYYMAYIEEKTNLLKWGNQYGQYMKQVPRFNFIKGLWNLKKRR